MKFINWVRRQFFGETKEQQDIRYVSKVTGWSEEFVRKFYDDAARAGKKITLE